MAPTAPQIKLMAVLIKQKNIPEFEWRRPLMEWWGYTSRRQLSVEEGGKFIDWLDKYGVIENEKDYNHGNTY